MRMAHTMIRVKDLDATVDFYVNFIGLSEQRRKAIGDEATLVWLVDGDGACQTVDERLARVVERQAGIGDHA